MTRRWFVHANGKQPLPVCGAVHSNLFRLKVTRFEFNARGQRAVCMDNLDRKHSRPFISDHFLPTFVLTFLAPQQDFTVCSKHAIFPGAIGRAATQQKQKVGSHA